MVPSEVTFESTGFSKPEKAAHYCPGVTAVPTFILLNVLGKLFNCISNWDSLV
ncbi:hypothetical protein [Desulfobacter hydrogenophilus]|uniref:hypothetical protein n=1 Tax=Desulfobacter hydrogenophilus TaxID=2291 RepID=UPI0013D07D33|nr:hypothetical protein [Desulfobacter hydrogenophilus]NDY72085.1 hypothetical protein [Desulfobacter hydrogenophilus]